jgi:hypothetical protein
MKDFWRKNRISLIAFSALISLIGMEQWITVLAFNPMTSEKFSVDLENQIRSRFRIIAKETYGVYLWIGKPNELDSDAFDRLTGCSGAWRLSRAVRGATIPFQWTVQSLSDERIVAKSDAPSITPPGNSCSIVAGGHRLYLGGFAINPGRYQFKFQFSEEIPPLKNFPTEISIGCCGQSGNTAVTDILRFTNFLLLPIMQWLAALLALMLLVRAGTALCAALVALRAG